jgi:uncharacterized protein (TIGR02001 family)
MFKTSFTELNVMKKTSIALLALALTGGVASAADLGKKKAPAPAPVVVSPWDFTVGGGLTSNYLFRGISQSNNAASVNANAELRYTFTNTWAAYVGTSGSSVKLTDTDQSPNMELDAMGGVRGTFGNLSTDVGAIAYIYPGLKTPTRVLEPVFPTNPTFYEGYVKLGYNITETINVGGNVFYSPSFLDTGANATYLSATAKWTLPMDFALSGEFGRQYLGNADVTHGGANLPDYNYWNAGLSYSYKFATLDLRYHGTDLSKTKCSAITGPTGTLTGQSKYCGAAVVGTLSFALSGKDLK